MQENAFKETLWKTVKLLKMSNFTVFHNVFYVICILKSFNSHISFLVYSFYEFGTVSKWCIREWVKYTLNRGRLENFLPFPVDSILLAVLTVSPNRQYRGIFLPTTPAQTGPESLILKTFNKELRVLITRLLKTPLANSFWDQPPKRAHIITKKAFETNFQEKCIWKHLHGKNFEKK